MAINCRPLLLPGFALLLPGAQLAMAAEAEAPLLVPSGLCLSQCENPEGCPDLPVESFPDFEISVAAIQANCEAAYLYAVEGVCADGKRLLHTGSGYTSQIRLYTAAGDFTALIGQSDAMSQPCMGQHVWPEYPRCETPVVVESLCGTAFNPGDPAFTDRWRE